MTAVLALAEPVAVPVPTLRPVSPGPAPEPPIPGATAWFADVLRELENGLTARRVAERLGLSDELVELALEHAERLGLVVRPGAAPGRCGAGCAVAALRPAACAGCLLTR